jgi:hypothetical protein
MKNFNAIGNPDSITDRSDDVSNDCLSYHMSFMFGFSLSAGRDEVRVYCFSWAQLKAEKQVTVPQGAPYLTLE